MPEGCKSLMLLPGQQCSSQLLWKVKQQQHRQSINSLSGLPVPVPDVACAAAQLRWCTWGFADRRLPGSTPPALLSTSEVVARCRIGSFLQQT